MARSYFERLASVTFNLIASSDEPMASPFLVPDRKGGTVGLLVISSDTGLSGSYSDRLLKTADLFMRDNPGRDIRIFAFGRKAANFYKKHGRPVFLAFPGIHGKLRQDFYVPVYEKLMEAFLKKEIAELHVAYTVFINPMKHHPVVEKLMTVDVPPDLKPSNIIVESGDRGIGSDILPMFIAHKLRLMFLESFASEHSARMVSMKSAKDNARELMGELILLRNKLRQATITREVIEIISSSEALKG
jgi:F-type H+-transporting ATPase subunit gamma